MTPPDVGHLGGGCDAYAWDASGSGSCALQHDAELSGTHFWRWAVAAVDAMASASRKTDQRECRDWFTDE